MTIANKTSLQTQQTQRPDRVTALYIGLTYEDWNDNTLWLPMMRISWDDAGYYYHSFTQAFADNYELVKGHVLNPKRGYTQTWKDKRITGIFDGRIPRRADSMSAYDLFGVGESKGDFISLFARNGGTRHGDRYDVFPEVTPNEAGEYEFWFRIYGLPTLISEGHEEVRAIADTIQPQQKLSLKTLASSTEIFGDKVHLGHCPSYIHYLLSQNPNCGYAIVADIVNQDEFRYAYKIIAKLTVNSASSIYTNCAFKPINQMPV